MKYLPLIVMMVAALTGRAYPPAPASQAAVNAGNEPYLYVTPQTLAGSTVMTSPAYDKYIGAYLASNNLYDMPSATRILNGVGVLKQYGVYSNLVDWIILKPSLGASNNLTLFGRQTIASNITYPDNWGAHFNGNGAALSSITLNVPYDLRTNTLVVTWRLTLNDAVQTGGQQQFLAGVGSWTTGSAIWHHFQLGQYEQVWCQNGTNIWPNSNTGYTNLLNVRNGDGYWDWGRIQTHQTERRVSVISAAGVVLSAFDGGRADTWTVAQNMYLATNTVPILDPLTNVLIGAMPTNTTISWLNPFKGEIDSVLVFNVPATTNLAVAATVAARCLEPETTEDIWVGDSLVAAYGTPWYGTNAMAAWYALRTGNNSTVNGAIGGTTWGNCWATATASNWLFSVPSPPGVTKRIFAGCGINDLYGTGLNAAQVWAAIQTFAGWCATNNARLIIADVYTVATNCQTYNYSAATEAQRIAVNNLILSNSWMFSGIIRRSAIANQDMLNTNNPLPYHYSYDGLHFLDLTNGCYGYKAMMDSWIGEGDYGVRPIADWSGRLYVQSSVVMNGVGGWSGILPGVITNTSGPHGFNVFIGGGVITNAVPY